MKKNKLLTIICILVVIIIIELFCFYGGSSKGSNSKSNGGMIYGIGDTIGQAKWFLTINSANWQSINGKSYLVVNITFDCKESHKKCSYESMTSVVNSAGNSLGNFLYADFESTVSDSKDSSVYGGESVTGNFYIEIEKQDDIYLSYLDSSDTSVSAFGKTYKIKLDI